jgi:hypothetical protein
MVDGLAGIHLPSLFNYSRLLLLNENMAHEIAASPARRHRQIAEIFDSASSLPSPFTSQEQEWLRRRYSILGADSADAFGSILRSASLGLAVLDEWTGWLNDAINGNATGHPARPSFSSYVTLLVDLAAPLEACRLEYEDGLRKGWQSFVVPFAVDLIHISKISLSEVAIHFHDLMLTLPSYPHESSEWWYQQIREARASGSSSRGAEVLITHLEFIRRPILSE